MIAKEIRLKKELERFEEEAALPSPTFRSDASQQRSKSAAPRRHKRQRPMGGSEEDDGYHRDYHQDEADEDGYGSYEEEDGGEDDGEDGEDYEACTEGGKGEAQCSCEGGVQGGGRNLWPGSP